MFELEPIERTPRVADPLWDAVLACYRLDAKQLTPSERGRLNKHLAHLRGVNADPAEIRRRRHHYRLRFPNAADTFPALVSHWAECATAPPAAPSRTLGALSRMVNDG